MQPQYQKQRQRTLAYGAPSAPIDLLAAFAQPWTAESEDFATLADALQLYGEQADTDYAVMKAMAYRQVDWHEFAAAEE